MKTSLVSTVALASSASACLHFYGQITNSGDLVEGVAEDTVNGQQQVVCDWEWGWGTSGHQGGAGYFIKCLDGYHLGMEGDASHFAFESPYGDSDHDNVVYYNAEGIAWDTRVYC